MPIPFELKSHILTAYEEYKAECQRGDLLKIDLAEAAMNSLLDRLPVTVVMDITCNTGKKEQ